jgi:hypothetical protein
VTITAIPGFNMLVLLERKTDVSKLQALQFGPLLFNVTLTTALATGGFTDYININPLNAADFPPQGSTVPQTDIICFWNRESASRCEKTATGFRVYAPFGSAIAAGQNYYVQITTNRDTTVGWTYPAPAI